MGHYLDGLMKRSPTGIYGVNQITLKGIESGFCKKLGTRKYAMQRTSKLMANRTNKSTFLLIRVDAGES